MQACVIKDSACNALIYPERSKIAFRHDGSGL